jgi:hypothetical protein
MQVPLHSNINNSSSKRNKQTKNPTTKGKKMLEGETQTSNIKIKEDRGSRIEKEKTLAHTRASKKKRR